MSAAEQTNAGESVAGNQDRFGAVRAAPLIPAVVALATIGGFLLRYVNLDQSVVADELSTYWILHGRSFGDVISLVHSDAEITPPLFFALAWVFSKLGSDPAWIKLPSLIAGTVTIPLIYVLGKKLMPRSGAAFATVLMALSPFMIFYSVEARAYAVMIMLLVLSTIGLVNGCETARKRWWALYAVCICATMYAHYTVVFCLMAQFLWAAWAHPKARKALLISTAAAAVGFLPWMSGFIADNNSPTTDILNALQPFNFGAVKFATIQWGIGYPYVALHVAPGHLAEIVVALGGVIIGVGVLVRLVRRRQAEGGPLLPALRPTPSVVLVVLLALATPVGEAVGSAIGTNLFGARNLNAAWPGLALLAGLLVSSAVPVAAITGGVLILGAFGIAASKTFDADFARSDYKAAAAYVDEHAAPDDVVLDGSVFTPVPVTGLDVYLKHRPELRIGFSHSDKPFAAGDYIPPINHILNRAFDEARGRRLFLVSLAAGNFVKNGGSTASLPRSPYIAKLLRDHPGFKITSTEAFAGIPPIDVYTFEDRKGADAGASP